MSSINIVGRCSPGKLSWLLDSIWRCVAKRPTCVASSPGYITRSIPHLSFAPQDNFWTSHFFCHCMSQHHPANEFEKIVGLEQLNAIGRPSLHAGREIFPRTARVSRDFAMYTHKHNQGAILPGCVFFQHGADSFFGSALILEPRASAAKNASRCVAGCAAQPAARGPGAHALARL